LQTHNAKNSEDSLYTSLFATIKEATAHITTIETENIKVTYINRQLAVNKLKHSTYLIEFIL